MQPVSVVSVETSPTIENESRVERLPYYNDATFTPRWVSENSDTLQSFHTIPAFKLTNQLGEQVTQATFENKIYVADFFFTICPGICPKMTENMSLLQQTFIDDDNVLLVSHSVTPETDTPATLKEYGSRKGVNASKWHLVTGDRQEIYNLGRNAYFIEEDLGVAKDMDNFLHTENFVLIDKQKHIRGIYNGLNKASIEQLIADIRTLEKEN